MPFVNVKVVKDQVNVEMKKQIIRNLTDFRVPCKIDKKSSVLYGIYSTGA